MGIFGFLKKDKKTSGEMDLPPPAPTPDKQEDPSASTDADLAMPSFPEPKDEDISLPPISDEPVGGFHDGGIPGYIPPPPGHTQEAPVAPEPEPMPVPQSFPEDLPGDPEPVPVPESEPVPEPEPEPVPEQEPEEPIEAPPEAPDEKTKKTEEGPKSKPALSARSVPDRGPLYIDIVSYTSALEDIKDAGNNFKELDDGLETVEKFHASQGQSLDALRKDLEMSVRRLQRIDKQILQKRW